MTFLIVLSIALSIPQDESDKDSASVTAPAEKTADTKADGQEAGEAVGEPSPADAYDESKMPIDFPPPGRTRSRSPLAGDSSGVLWTVFWSVMVIALLVVVLWLIRRFLKNSRFVMGGGAIRLIARHSLDQHARVYLVEVGETIFLIGGAREGLSSLGTIRDPEEVAAVRAQVGGARPDSSSRLFKDRLSEELKASERTAGAQKIRDQLGRIKDTMKRWGNAGA